MKTIYLSAGHSNTPGKDRGAAANGYIEGDLTVELRDMVAAILRQAGCVVITDSNGAVTGDMVREFDKRLTGNAIVVDFHFNAAAAPKATGTEVVTRAAASQKEKGLATVLSETIAKRLGIFNRGVKTEAQSARGKLFLFEQISDKEAITVLPEICFISNPDNMKRYTENKAALAKDIAGVLIQYAQ